MLHQLSWKVGGQQGEGIESTGEIFAMAMNRLGYHLYGYRHFSSRIKGAIQTIKLPFARHRFVQLRTIWIFWLHSTRKRLKSIIRN